MRSRSEALMSRNSIPNMSVVTRRTIPVTRNASSYLAKRHAAVTSSPARPGSIDLTPIPASLMSLMTQRAFPIRA